MGITIGLYYNGARYLAAWLGRWTSADPIGMQAGVNLYQYCRGSPVMMADPSGLDPVNWGTATPAAKLKTDDELAEESAFNPDEAKPAVKIWTRASKALSNSNVEFGRDVVQSLGRLQGMRGGPTATPEQLKRFDAQVDRMAGAMTFDDVPERDQKIMAVAEAVGAGYGLLKGGIKGIRWLSKLGKAEVGAAKSVDDVVTVVGAAQAPRAVPFAKNADGARTVEEAVELARKAGIEIGDDVKFFKTEVNVPKGADASYMARDFGQGDMVEFDALKNQFGRVPIRVRPEVFESDEHIISVFAHEMHEVNSLRSMFDARGQMSAAELRRLTIDGIPGNLHDRAWDVADDFVRLFRGEAK